NDLNEQLNSQLHADLNNQLLSTSKSTSTLESSANVVVHDILTSCNTTLRAVNISSEFNELNIIA
ncbi:hypothetical protein AJ78_08914, partial [Emergomyces pasteurianus Ep9510]